MIALVASGPLFHACDADPLTLNINVNTEGRQFLITNKQKIIIALANPLSEDNTAIVVSMAFQPIADSTQIAFDSENVALYLAHMPMPVDAFDTINIDQAVQAKVAYGQAYSFNGTQINGENGGLKGYVTIYFEAPNSTQPVVTGLAWNIYDKAMGEPMTPLPINYFTLNNLQNRVIPKPNPIVWVFIASDISVGSVLPISILKSELSAAQVLNDKTAVPQIGRYLSVNLDAPEQTTIHFENAANAFVYGSYP